MDKTVNFIRQFTRNVKIAMLSTIDHGIVFNSLSATCEIDNNGYIWIITGNKIRTKSNGTLLYTHNTLDTYLCIDGTIEEMHQADSKKYREWLQRTNIQAGMNLIKMIINKAAYWDNRTTKMTRLYPLTEE